MDRAVLRTPRAAGAACLLIAGLLGLVHLRLAGAPPRLLVVNAGALAVGLAALAIGVQIGSRWPLPAAGSVFGIAAAMLLTALFGHETDGVRRWIAAGGVTLQPGLILVPALAVLIARAPTRQAAAGVAATAAALALQPDRGTAGALALAMLVAFVGLPRRATGLACAAAAIGFGVTLVRADPLAPACFVEGVLPDAAAHGPIAAAAAWTGAALLLAPGLARDRRAAAFAAMWLGLILAALVGDYPTPVIGHSASAILGYALSLAALPRAGTPRSLRGR